jgi:hypothetical protein
VGAAPAPTNDNGQAALLALSQALSVLARRLRSGSVAADDFARLTARAKAIAAQAWELRTTRWAFVENAAKLADDLVAFALESQAASERAAAMVSGNVAVIETLEAHAARIAALHSGGAADAASWRQAIRAELEPLESTLTTFRARLAVEHSASEDAKALAAQASGLAQCSLGLRGGERSAETAAEVHKALSLFVVDATGVAQRIAQAAQRTATIAAHLAPGLSEGGASQIGRDVSAAGPGSATLKSAGAASGRQW